MNTPSLLSTLETYVRLNGQREQSIAANMANIDTPGYRARDLDFDRELHRAGMFDAQFGGTAARLTPVLHQTTGLIERPDGNDVDLDREGLLLSQTQLQSQLGTQLIKHHFHNLLSAINGGSGS